MLNPELTTPNDLQEEAVTYTVASPDASLVVAVTSKDGGLSYSVMRNNTELISDSPISIRTPVDHEVTGDSSSSHDSTWTPTWGQFSSIRDYHNRLTLDLDVGGIDFALIFQVYNDGLGFRFSADEQESLTGTTVNFNVRYNMKNDYMGHWPGGERSPHGPVAIQSLTVNPHTPLLINANTDGFLALLESDLYSAKNFESMPLQRVNGEPAVSSNRGSGTIAAGSLLTPWRVVLVGDSPGDLLESTVSVNLAAPLELNDVSWIKPGKSLWDWRINGYTTDDSSFSYGLNTASLNRMVDYASENGLEYVLVDDNWWTLIRDGQLISQASGFDINAVISHADDNDVGILLYFDRSPASRVQNTTDTQLFDLYETLGVSGIKYGFRGDNASFTREAVSGGAAREMLIDFHDSPTRLTGARRTIPSAITREGGWAQQDARRAFSPTDFLEMAMIKVV